MVNGMVRRWGRLMWALVGMLALTGCAPSEAEESPTPTVPVTSSDATEPVTDETTDGDPGDPPEPPDVDPPERPAAMDEETVDGAIAAAKYFVMLYPYVYATGDLEEWNALSDDGCGFCENVQERAEDLHADGGFSVGGTAEIASSDGGGPYEDDVYTIELGIRIASSEFVYPDGTRTPYSAIDDPTFILSMRWEGGAWRVLGVLAGEDT